MASGNEMVTTTVAVVKELRTVTDMGFLRFLLEFKLSGGSLRGHSQDSPKSAEKIEGVYIYVCYYYCINNNNNNNEL